jgi:glycolate oxidase
VREAVDLADRERLWAGRKGAISAIGRLVPNYYVLDGVVPRTKLPQAMKQVMALAERYGFRCANMFHAGDGNLHPTVMFDPTVPGAAARVLELGGEIMRVCVNAGGSVTGEHGIGLEKRSYMEWIFSASDLDAMGRVRVAFGGEDRFNPCKLLPTGRGCGNAHAGEAMRHVATPGVYV